MRLLQVATIPETIDAFLLPLARRFRSEGWTVGAMARGVTGHDRCRAEFDRLHDVGWSRNPLDPANLAAVPTVRRVVADEGYDLVHVHTPIASFVTRYALRHRPRPYRIVYTAHGFHFYDGGPALPNLVFRTLERVAGPWTDALVVINREDEAAARRDHLVPEAWLRFVPGVGVDLSDLDPERIPQERLDAVRDELGLPPGAQLLLMVADFSPNKRHADAVRAFAGLAQGDAGHPAPHLAFAGKGATYDATVRQVREAGLSDRVHFLGYRHDVPVLIRAADAVLLPSGREGLPRTVLEAMALGTPVLASDVRGVRDLLGDGRGVLVPVGDVDALRAGMARVLHDIETTREMVARARAHVAAYDVGEVLETYATLYREVIATRPAVRAAAS